METLTRQAFLQRSSMAGAAILLSSLEGFALGNDEKKVRVAVIGCGSVSTQYLPHLTKASHVEIVSCCDIKFERAQLRAKEYNIPHAYPHIDKMLAGAKFDLMVNLTDMQEHGRLNRQAFNARST